MSADTPLVWQQNDNLDSVHQLAAGAASLGIMSWTFYSEVKVGTGLQRQTSGTVTWI